MKFVEISIIGDRHDIWVTFFLCFYKNHVFQIFRVGCNTCFRLFLNLKLIVKVLVRKKFLIFLNKIFLEVRDNLLTTVEFFQLLINL